MKSKLVTKLIKLKSKLTQQLKEIDKNNTGFINFIQLRQIFENIKINLSDDLLEYLIHLMKKFNHTEANSLEDLKYEVFMIKFRMSSV
jgi:Ca2+-binding EF-hand superfamily protein